MLWRLYRVLDEKHEQQPLDTGGFEGLSFDPESRAVHSSDGPVATTNLVVARKDGRQIAIIGFEGHPKLRFCFEEGPAKEREYTERAHGLKGALEDVIPDTTNYPATVVDCYEQGDLVFLVFDLDHDNGKGCVATANRADTDDEVEQQLLKQISDTQTELFEGYHPDDVDDYDM